MQSILDLCPLHSAINDISGYINFFWIIKLFRKYSLYNDIFFNKLLFSISWKFLFLLIVKLKNKF